MNIKLALIAVLALGTVWANAPKFEPVPNAAFKYLKGTRGKPIRKGVVFVNGRYLPPPYTVWRRGTAVYIGKTQITGQIVPWASFVASQKSGDGAAERPPAENKQPATVRSIDDLFDDEPAPAKKSEASAEPAFTGNFIPNELTKHYMKRIMAFRTDVDRRLRRGEILFFGSRYSMLPVEDRLCMPLMRALPKAMRDASDASDLQARLRSQGITYLGATLCEELFANQASSFALDERRKKMQDELDVLKILDDGAQGVVR